MYYAIGASHKYMLFSYDKTRLIHYTLKKFIKPNTL